MTVKYVFILLRADNNGEGGTLTLVALAQRALGQRRGLVLLLGIAGAGLFYGDAVITPAISVLSAVEGLKLVTPALEAYVVPITLAILVALFAVQSRGTGRVAAFFGPIMLVWFATLALTGLLHIADDPAVLSAINPVYAASPSSSTIPACRSPCSARSASPSRAPRRSTPISAISAAGRSASPGSASCSRRW